MNAQGDSSNAEVAAQEARVAALARQLADAQASLSALRANADAEQSERSSLPILPGEAPTRTRSKTEKIALFRSLFRGRDDTYPKFWHHVRNSRSGYAPACRNEWVSGVCNKPRIKCGECPNQAFLSVTDQVIEDHVRGRHGVGVYPLLTDETCWCLAADFDDSGWRDDVAAFAETSRSFGIVPSIERSRSGAGAHAWLFFAEPMSAHVARALGCFLLTETTARRHQLRLTSYDRLFPNQDTLPRGGFGNLIALPLQREAAERGHTLFLDEQLQPFPDQWEHLAGVARLLRPFVADLVANAEHRGNVLGVRAVADHDDQLGDVPWKPKPSEWQRIPAIAGPLPEKVDAVLAHRLFIPTAGLSSPLIAHISRLAAFQNPEFYQKQRLRLSTHGTPRIISCAEQLPEHLVLPRGCQDDLRDLLTTLGIVLSIRDERSDGLPLAASFAGSLNREQERAVEALACAETGVLVAPPGTGKTVMAIALLVRRARNTLVLVHRRPLVEQWVARLAAFTGGAPTDIGQVTAGKRRVTGRIDVATVQSFVRRGVVDDMVASYGHVIVDECHHVAAVSIECVLREVRARYVTGLTATPTRRDGLQPIVHMQLGPIRHVMRSHADRPEFAQRLVVRDTPFDGPGTEQSIHELYTALGACEARNDQIFDDLLLALEEGRSPILLTERRDHLNYFAARLAGFARNVIVLHGGRPATARHEALQALATIPADVERAVLATGRYAGEGLDDARLDTLFLAMPFAWRGTLVQYAGRLQRAYATKREVRVYDYVDRSVPVLVRMFQKRLRGYRALGYDVPS
ncbi:MAG: TOTE conflict system archaeo-eukaryotic primase domain-containing protein [Gemmatimonadales bacterium]